MDETVAPEHEFDCIENVEKMARKSGDKRRKSDDKQSIKLSNDDYGIILNWLELEGNKVKIDGVEKKTNVGEKPVVKMQGYKELAKYLNANQKPGSTLVPLTGLSMKARWTYYFKRYRAVKALNQQPDYGVTEADRLNDILTIEERNESKCPHYERMDKIFSTNANEVAFATDDSALRDGDNNISWMDPPSIADNEVIGLEDNCVDNYDGVQDTERNEERPSSNAVEESIDPSRDPSLQSPTGVSTATSIQDLIVRPEPTPIRSATLGLVTHTAKKRAANDGHSVPCKKTACPSESEIREIRHSINSVFGVKLEASNQLRAEATKAKHLTEEKKLKWDMERFEREKLDRNKEREQATLEQAKDREHAHRMQKDKQKFELVMAMINNNKSADEIKEVLNLLE